MKARSVLISFFLLFFLLSSNNASARIDSIKQNIDDIIKSVNADIGVVVQSFDDNESLIINGDKRYPMQSVYKLHLALAVLNQVDKGKLSLSQKIFVTKKDLLPDTWSPLREKYPNGDVHISLEEILIYTVSHSDNNGCDILFRLIGGPKKVDKYIHKLGVKDVSIAATEEEMHKSWDVQFTNWSTPSSVILLLEKFFKQKILSKNSYDFLWKAMVATTTGAKRIKGLLPTETIVAHRTGLSGTNEQGITAANNDVGIVTLPNGKHFAIAVFVSNSKENNQTNDRTIARITKIVWDYFLAK